MGSKYLREVLVHFFTQGLLLIYHAAVDDCWTMVLASSSLGFTQSSGDPGSLRNGSVGCYLHVDWLLLVGLCRVWNLDWALSGIVSQSGVEDVEGV